MKKAVACVASMAFLLAAFCFSSCSFFDEGSSNRNTIGKIGDTISNADNVSICLVSCENTKELGSGFLSDTTENNFILLSLKVTNNSSEQQTFSGSCVDLYNSKKVKYETKTSLYIDYILSEDIGVGVTKSFQVVFETPTTTLEEEYTAKVGYSTYTADSKRVTFVLKENYNSSESKDKNDSDNINDKDSSDLSQYYSEDCPISLNANIHTDLTLVFNNVTEKKIIAYEAVFILYNVYGEGLRYTWNDSIYNKLSETPTGFVPQGKDYQYISITDKVYTAEVYVYYVLCEDQTSWGCRDNITIEDIQKYCTCTKVVKG